MATLGIDASMAASEQHGSCAQVGRPRQRSWSVRLLCMLLANPETVQQR